MDEFDYVSRSDIVWKCMVCQLSVQSEPTQILDEQQQVITAYIPSSRYWTPGSKPGLTRGVLCGVKCSMVHQGLQRLLFDL